MPWIATGRNCLGYLGGRTQARRVIHQNCARTRSEQLIPLRHLGAPEGALPRCFRYTARLLALFGVALALAACGARVRVEPERVPTSTASETVSDEDRFVIRIQGGQLNYFFPDSDRALATARKVCDMLNRARVIRDHRLLRRKPVRTFRAVARGRRRMHRPRQRYDLRTLSNDIGWQPKPRGEDSERHRFVPVLGSTGVMLGHPRHPSHRRKRHQTQCR
jgi:hypothetical protein